MLRVVVPYDLVLALTQSHTSMLGRCLLHWGGCRSSRAWLARARISPVQGESSGRGRTALVSWCSAAPAAAHTFGSWSKGTECEIGASAGARRRRSARACLPSSGVWGRTNLCQTEKNLVVFIRARALLQLSWQKAALFPAEIPKHLPVSRLLAARNPTRCRDCRGKAARYWSGRRRAGKYLCKAHRAQRLAHAVSAGGGEGKEGLAFSRIKSQKSIRCLFLAKLKRFLSSRECGDLLPD